MTRETKLNCRFSTPAREPTLDLDDFDYNASAELFMSPSRADNSQTKYKRFDTASEAIRFVVENLPAAVLLGAYLLVDEARFGVEDIRSLYDSARYPLPRAIENC